MNNTGNCSNVAIDEPSKMEEIIPISTITPIITNNNLDQKQQQQQQQQQQKQQEEEDEHTLKKLKVDNNDNQETTPITNITTNTTTTTVTVTNNNTNNNDDNNNKKNNKNNKFKQQNNQFIYGNYHGYYNYRNESVIEQDNRIKYLTKDLFHQKRCLDIGCNSGDLVFKISKDYQPTHITGIDIDKYLINKAYHQLTFEQSTLSNNNNNNKNNNNNNNNTKGTEENSTNHSYTITTTIIDSNNLKIDKKDFIPISFRMISDGIISNQFPHNISFYCQNFLYTSKIVDKQNSYDVITALSISKWIQLNWGDEGIKKFLIKTYSLLKDGGIFLFEPQPWKGYGKRKNLTELINKNYQEIKFKPDQFTNFLIETVGYKSFEFLNSNEAKSKGFDRPLYKFIK
ncbi:hypothetical protein ACTFIW_007737 [Dictyostelium discoideum]